MPHYNKSTVEGTKQCTPRLTNTQISVTYNTLLKLIRAMCIFCSADSALMSGGDVKDRLHLPFILGYLRGICNIVPDSKAAYYLFQHLFSAMLAKTYR